MGKRETVTITEADLIGGGGESSVLKEFAEPRACGFGHPIPARTPMPYVHRGITADRGRTEPAYKCPVCKGWWPESCWISLVVDEPPNPAGPTLSFYGQQPYAPSQQPRVCVVCAGRGRVAAGFYNVTGIGSTTNAEPETCRACQGGGVLWR